MEHENMSMKKYAGRLLAATIIAGSSLGAQAGESLLNYVTGTDTQPEGSWEFIQWVTQRSDKGAGSYTARDYRTEVEYGFSDRFSAALYINGQSIDTSGLRVDAYIPQDVSYGYKYSGISAAFKYNILSPYKDGLGLSLYFEPSLGTRDPHSGLNKKTVSFETKLLLQKNFLDDTLNWMTNIGLEATYAKRDPVSNLPPGYDWPVVPEMEIEPSFATGVSYRFAPRWYVGAEAQYQIEYETEVGVERWSWFAGPTIHYGTKDWWATLTWFKQIKGGGEAFPEQDDPELHLVEKTKNEIRLKVGIDF
jgi:hypothetical protein